MRGSSSRGAREGLLGLEQVIESGGPAIFTADGPRGPIYRTKMGPIKLAQMTGAPIGAFHLEPEHAWTSAHGTDSWCPSPSRASASVGRSGLGVPSDLPPEQFETKREELNAAIERARLRALEHFGKVSG